MKQAMAASVLTQTGTGLICWEHDNIMPNIMQAIHGSVPISNYASIPNPFPDVFYLVWILDLASDGKSYTWSSVNQNLMAGDIGPALADGNSGSIGTTWTRQSWAPRREARSAATFTASAE